MARPAPVGSVASQEARMRPTTPRSRAPMPRASPTPSTAPTRVCVVEIGSPVPGEGEDDRFNRIGEALSFDGRWLAFWGAWGDETRDLLLTCPEDGQADVIAYCNEQYPDGLTVQVPVHQGMFAIDTQTGAVSASYRVLMSALNIWADTKYRGAKRAPGCRVVSMA